MGWNGSGGGSTPVKPKGKYPPSEASFAKQSGYRGAKKPSPVRGIVAGLVVVAAVYVAYFAFFSGSEKPQKVVEQKKPKAIKEVTPAPAPKEVFDTDKDSSPPTPKTKPTKSFEVVNGMIMLSNGKIVPTNKIAKVHTRASDIRRAKFAIFEHSTDNEFAALLTLPPGKSLIGGPIRHADYKADFLKSLETPIIIKQDDSDEDKELKRSVIEVRKEIKAAIDRGEDPVVIIKAAYEDAQKLEMYKQDIETQMRNIAKEGEYSDQDIEDLISASNRMLEEKGIAPMKLTPFAKERLRGDVRRYSEIVSEDLARRRAAAAANENSKPN